LSADDSRPFVLTALEVASATPAGLVAGSSLHILPEIDPDCTGLSEVGATVGATKQTPCLFVEVRGKVISQRDIVALPVLLISGGKRDKWDGFVKVQLRHNQGC
jgi:hypothetical protein